MTNKAIDWLAVIPVVLGIVALGSLALGIAGCKTAPSGGDLPPVEDRGPTGAVDPAGESPATVQIQALDEVDPIRPEGMMPEPPMPMLKDTTVVSAQTPSPGVIALLDESARHLDQGDLDKAAASLERALRIEPQNAAIWYDLAQVRYRQGEYQQAEALASRSRSLAGQDRTLEALTWRLTSRARAARGDSVGADEAEAQAVLLERYQ